MKPVSQALARQHGGSVSAWRAALSAAGVRPDAPLTGLTPFERRAVERLVAARREAPPEAVAPGPSAARQSRRQESPLVRWARESMQHYFGTWERRRLGEAPTSIATTLAGVGSGIPIAPAGPPGSLGPNEPGPPFGPELAAHLSEDRWSALPEPTRRVLGLLVALSRDPVLDRLARALHPRRLPGAHPLRVLVRLAFARAEQRTSALALPDDLVMTGRQAGLDWCALRPQTAGALTATAKSAPGQPTRTVPPQTPEPGLAPLSEVVELLARVPQPSEHSPPHTWAPATREALEGVESRWRHRRAVAERGLDLGSGGLIALFEGEEDHGQVPAASKLAADLGLELFRLHAGLLQSRYIGEAERRFSAVLEHLHERGAALLVTGAQDLVAPRTEVETSRDRYSNMAVNHILSELEGWSGLCILCAPSMTGLDGAMQRRIRARISFAPLDGATRRAHLVATWSWLERRAGPAVSAAREAALDALATLQLGGEALTRRALELGFALELGHLDGSEAALSAWVRGT